jgi:hypothetical protein
VNVSRTDAARTPSKRRRRTELLAGAMVASLLASLALAAIVTSSGAAAPAIAPIHAAATPAHPALASLPLTGARPAASAPSATWAWGVQANLSATLDFVGAYNASQNLTGANLTVSGAHLAVHESFSIAYAAFAVVNMT